MQIQKSITAINTNRFEQPFNFALKSNHFRLQERFQWANIRTFSLYQHYPPFKATFRTVECTHHTSNSWKDEWKSGKGLPFYWCPPARRRLGLHCKFFQPNMQPAFGSRNNIQKRTKPRISWVGAASDAANIDWARVLASVPFFSSSNIHVWGACVLSLHCDAMREYF